MTDIIGATLHMLWKPVLSLIVIVTVVKIIERMNRTYGGRH